MKGSLWRLSLGCLVIVFLSPLINTCIFVDPNNNDNNDPTESVTYVNNTDYTVDNYIDDVYQESVGPYDTQTISGNLEGSHKYFSTATSAGWEWGPDYFSIADGEGLTIYLDPPSDSSTAPVQRAFRD